MLRYYGMAGALFGFVALSSAASAQSGHWYIAGSAGGLFMQDYSRNVTIYNGFGQTAPGTNTSTFNPGEAVTASVGYRLPLGFRTEAEFGYLHFSVNSIDPFSNSPLFPSLKGAKLTNPSGGDYNRYTAMANLFYDIPVNVLGGTPYIGGGAGYYYQTSTDAIFTLPTGQKFSAGGASGGNAVVMGEIGLSAPLTQSLSLVPSYRYQYFAGTDIAHSAHIVKIGLRYTFGAPPPVSVTGSPPPMPMPQQAAARSFLVFFDWDKADLTARASQIVAEAAATSTKVQVTRIEVAGYTDTSGTPAYNKGLSIRRAQAVAEALIKDGVPKSAISIQGFGDTHLLVATGPGVREPQNRRVEIVLK